MNPSLKSIRWLHVVASSLAVVVASFLVVTLATTGYAFFLAFEAHGKPDQQAIGHFAGTISRWLMPLSEMLFTFLVAMIATKKIQMVTSVHGILVGIFAGCLATVLGLGFGAQLDLRMCGSFVLLVGVGFAGGYLGQRQLAKSMSSPA